MRRGLALLTLLLVTLLGTLPAGAHSQSTAWLHITAGPASPAALRLQLDLALVDLEQRFALDRDGDDLIRWGEVRTRREELSGWAGAGLGLRTAGGDCALHFRDLLAGQHPDGGYAVLQFTADCPSAVADDTTLELRYELLFDQDAAHRLLVARDGASGSLASGVVSSDSRALQLGGGAASGAGGFDSWLLQGIWHIWTGYDHLLFLLTLLLPAVVERRDGRWVAQPALGPAWWDVVRVVTAFTVAHSLTLVLATLGRLPFATAWVEAAIALTVLFGALNILRPVVRRRWLLAFGFGLVHGLGFAALLGDLSLDSVHRVRDLLAFNLGVEAGQLAVVAVLVPLGFLARHRRWYRDATTPMLAVLIAAAALWWLWQRLPALSAAASG